MMMMMCCSLYIGAIEHGTTLRRCSGGIKLRAPVDCIKDTQMASTEQAEAIIKKSDSSG